MYNSRSHHIFIFKYTESLVHVLSDVPILCTKTPFCFLNCKSRAHPASNFRHPWFEGYVRKPVYNPALVTMVNDCGIGSLLVFPLFFKPQSSPHLLVYLRLAIYAGHEEFVLPLVRGTYWNIPSIQNITRPQAVPAFAFVTSVLYNLSAPSHLFLPQKRLFPGIWLGLWHLCSKLRLDEANEAP